MAKTSIKKLKKRAMAETRRMASDGLAAARGAGKRGRKIERQAVEAARSMAADGMDAVRDAGRRGRKIEKQAVRRTRQVAEGGLDAARDASAGARKQARTWAKRAKDVTEDDVRFVVEHGVDAADSLLSSAKGWLSRLGRRIRMAYDMLMAWWMGRFEFPTSTVAALTLALLYFINPFDLIPDFLPFVGMIDEAMVFAFVTKLMDGDLRRYARKFGLAPAEVGLNEPPARSR